MKPKRSPLLLVSNRLPVVFEQDDGHWQAKPGSGGLVTAMEPALRTHGGRWVGWPGCGPEAPFAEFLPDLESQMGFPLTPVPLTEEEAEKYYRGFSNETLWPLFHDLLGHCRFDEETWRTYLAVNERFAERVAGQKAAGDVVWVHDYQLAMVGAFLRQKGLGGPLGYFLHIPFPGLDLFRRLPWKTELLRGLLEYDLIGLQTLRDRRNFISCATHLLPETKVLRRFRHFTLLSYGSRQVKVAHLPISIDFDEFEQEATSREVADAAWYLHEKLEGRQLILGIDRLDYTKGLPERFLAFERALEKYQFLKRNCSLLQVVVPSRTLVPDYQNLKELLDQLAGRINSRFGEAGWTPIQYFYRSLDKVQLLAHYRTSEIALVTPLRDGMNLVAKEYCACSVDNNGVLILSEFAGAADQLGGNALLVNPYDVNGTADAIARAFQMNPEERQRRMAKLRSEIRQHNVHQWAERFLYLLGKDSDSPGDGIG